MAHIFSDNNEDKRIPFYFTIGVAVGKGHAGAPHEDVALVRWMLRNCYSPSMQSESAKACNALAPVGGCDQPLIDAITAVQRLNFPSNMDGYVSPMKDTKTIL